MSTAAMSLYEELRAQGGLMAGLLPRDTSGAVEPSGPARLVAAGPRAQAASGEYELLVELIYEGYLLHYGPPRLLRCGDRDLSLLAGDRLYALGLERLVALGDLPAVAELADVIALAALAHAAAARDLAAAVWQAGALAVGWGSSEAHARAKALVRRRDPAALGAMRALLADRYS